MSGRSGRLSLAAAERLDLDRRREDRLLGREEPEPLPVQRLEVAPHDAWLRQRDRQRRVGAGVAQMHERLDRDVVVLDTLIQQLLGRRTAEVVGEALDGVHGSTIERHLERALAARAHRGKPHAVGGQQPRQRMHEDRLHAERVRDETGVLAASGAKAVQRVAGHVVAALDRDFLDGVGHVFDRDADCAVGDLLRRAPIADLGGELREGRAHGVRVERLVAIGPEDRGEVRRVELAQHDVGVGHGKRAAAAVAPRPRIGAGALRDRRGSACRRR